jgi:PKD repeat protein
MKSLRRTTEHRRASTRRWARSALAAVLYTGGLAGALIVATPSLASAATTTLTAPTTLTGSQVLSSTSVTATGAAVTATFDLLTSAHWTQSAALLNTAFDANLVRQGRSLNPSDSYSRTSPGSMSITWTLNNLAVSWNGIGPLDLGNPEFSATGLCDLMASGANYTCHLVSPAITLTDLYPLPGPYVDLGLKADVTVTPQGIITLRQTTFGGNPGGSANLTLNETPVTDNLAVPCTVGKGDNLSYSLGALSTDPGISVATSLVFDVGVETPTPITIFPEIKFGFASPTIPLGTTASDIPMTGAGATFDMGSVQANNVPPVVNAGGPYSGNEGSPFTFDGSASSSICGFPTLQWNFSDGGVAYGMAPQHTFPGSGTYSGLLTATDVTGLTSLTTFSVTVVNLPPAVVAGPDTTSPWGRLVIFSGSATDPGTADQATLSYSWDFGDGNASGGASTLHVYATPGDYLATLTVTDQYGAYSSSSRTVHVTKRSTTTAYTGDTAGTFDTAATLAGSLVDQFGQPVGGRTVSFQVGANGPFSALTNSSGLASMSYTPALIAGGYSGTATFAGDALYLPSSSSESFTVAKKVTTTTYTGALSGKPNKSVALSATLKDASGKALGGRTVKFTLGSQSANAVTNPFGVASTTLVLNQKNGTYTVSATYLPTATPPDDSYFLGSSQSTTFLLQTK